MIFFVIIIYKVTLTDPQTLKTISVDYLDGYICDECKAELDETCFSYNCMLCQYDICIDCYYDLTTKPNDEEENLNYYHHHKLLRIIIIYLQIAIFMIIKVI